MQAASGDVSASKDDKQNWLNTLWVRFLLFLVVVAVLLLLVPFMLLYVAVRSCQRSRDQDTASTPMGNEIGRYFGVPAAVVAIIALAPLILLEVVTRACVRRCWRTNKVEEEGRETGLADPGGSTTARMVEDSQDAAQGRIKSRGLGPT